MDCEAARAAISEAIDRGVPIGRTVLDHLEHCAACRSYQEAAHRLRRATMHPVAEQTTVAVARLPERFVMHRWVRFFLAATALLLIGANVIGMFSVGSGTATHLARHEAAFDVALGLAFLFVAYRPDRAYGMVPFAATFAFALTVAALIDLVRGATTWVRESAHLIELAGLGLVWWLGAAVGPGRRRR